MSLTKKTEPAKIDTPPKPKPRYIGKRQARIERFLEQFHGLAPEELDMAKLEPVLIPSSVTQLKRGYRTKSNDECHCGSGKKFKHCHKALEKMTPRLDEDGKVVVYNPYTDKWVSVLELDTYIKQFDK